MHARHVIGLVLGILTIPVLALGIFDPLEGGMAMLMAGAIIVATWLISRVPVPRLEWVAWVATAALSGTALTSAVLLRTAEVTGPGLGIPWWLVALIAGYELGVVVTFAGGVWYVVRLLRVVRDHRVPVAGAPVH